MKPMAEPRTGKEVSLGAIDPITLEVVCEGLISVVREMRQTVFRAAYSSILYEGQDFSCALFDPRAQMVAQSEDLPSHVAPIASAESSMILR